jgi:cytolysin (calcineurin-like family phosphatase)
MLRVSPVTRGTTKARRLNKNEWGFLDWYRKDLRDFVEHVFSTRD